MRIAALYDVPLLGRDVGLRRTPYDVVRAVAALRSAGPATDHWVSDIERRARA
jgi:hypothetical protein